MMARLRVLEQRRISLVGRSGRQRARLAERAAPLAEPVRAAERIVRGVQEHPVLTAVATLAVLFVARRRLVRWAIAIAPYYSLLKSITGQLR